MTVHQLIGGAKSVSVFRLLSAAMLLLVAVLLPLVPRAAAQPCTADSQCRDYGQSRTYCSGNTLVTRRNMCVGSCRETEVSRRACPGPCVADRCVGGSLGSQPPGPPLGGSLVGGACGRICTCRGRQLTYGVGVARSADQCRRRSVDCVYGCTCDPEPRCLKRGEV